MNTGTSNKVQVSRRARDVRDSWTPHERRRRKMEGRRRSEQFVRLISPPSNDHEIWAAGALTVADFERLSCAGASL